MSYQHLELLAFKKVTTRDASISHPPLYGGNADKFYTNICKGRELEVKKNEERVALLKIKKDLKDPANCLSSWVGKDCCNWNGKFNSLFDLDLSNNSLSGPIPASIGNLSNLRSLNLEGNMMNGKIPEKQLGRRNDKYSFPKSHKPNRFLYII
ncbi:putative leucine-rich repeat receptor protein kinase [Spatholobus suberectus]|nr:putative leucine-rich repeat receptor protein kinase [Spatholobus suberectus]